MRKLEETSLYIHFLGKIWFELLKSLYTNENFAASGYLCCGEVTKGISKSICYKEESCSYKRAVLSVVEKTLDMVYQKSSSLSKVV